MEDRAGAMFCGLARKIKFGLFSSKRESPEVRIEACIDMDIYQAYLADIGVVKKSRERNVHCLNDNNQLCDILGNKWYERILNINGDFCDVVAGTVRFWLHEKNPVNEFVYIGEKLFESHIQNDLQLVFTFVRGDGVEVQYTTDSWK